MSALAQTLSLLQLAEVKVDLTSIIEQYAKPTPVPREKRVIKPKPLPVYPLDNLMTLKLENHQIRFITNTVSKYCHTHSTMLFDPPSPALPSLALDTVQLNKCLSEIHRALNESRRLAFHFTQPNTVFMLTGKDGKVYGHVCLERHQNYTVALPAVRHGNAWYIIKLRTPIQLRHWTYLGSSIEVDLIPKEHVA